jgi:hypothetical protein
MLYNPPGPGNEREPNETNWSRTWSHLITPVITSIHAIQGLGEPLPGQFGDAKTPNFSRYAVILNAEARHMQLQDAVSMFWILLVVFGASLICLYCDLGTATTHFGSFWYLHVFASELSKSVSDWLQWHDAGIFTTWGMFLPRHVFSWQKTDTILTHFIYSLGISGSILAGDRVSSTPPSYRGCAGSARGTVQDLTSD